MRQSVRTRPKIREEPAHMSPSMLQYVIDYMNACCHLTSNITQRCPWEPAITQCASSPKAYEGQPYLEGYGTGGAYFNRVSCVIS